MRNIFVDEQLIRNVGCSIAITNAHERADEPYVNLHDLVDYIQNKCNTDAQNIVSANMTNGELDTRYASGRWEALSELIRELKTW